MRGEVTAYACQEILAADVGLQLLQRRGAFGVGDAVKVLLDGFDIRRIRGDGVRGGQLILLVGPGLLHVGEGDPGGVVLGFLRLGDGRGPGGKRLVEPQVVPPLHGHEVAEPHVGELVEDGVRAALVLVVRRRRGEDVLVANGHAAGVLHRTRVEFRHEDLVVLAKRVGVTEVAVVEVEALLGLREQALGVEGVLEGLAAVDAQRHREHLRGLALRVLRKRALPHIRDAVVGTRAQGNEVRGERVVDLAVPASPIKFNGAIGDDRPVARGRKGQRVRRLEVRLVEAGEDALGIGRFELGVEVRLVIGRVHEAV